MAPIRIWHTNQIMYITNLTVPKFMHLFTMSEKICYIFSCQTSLCGLIDSGSLCNLPSPWAFKLNRHNFDELFDIYSTELGARFYTDGIIMNLLVWFDTFVSRVYIALFLLQMNPLLDIQLFLFISTIQLWVLNGVAYRLYGFFA